MKQSKIIIDYFERSAQSSWVDELLMVLAPSEL